MPNLFELLKQQVETTYRQDHPEETAPIGSWKGQQIVAFQEHLARRVQGRISEKWFYTYLKGDSPGKLPRVDMLDMLSAYVGHTDWQTFVARHQAAGAAPTQAARLPRWWWVPAVLGVLAAGWALGRLGTRSQGVYRICVEDAIRGTLLDDIPIEVTILYPDQSPVRVVDEDGGCLELHLPQEVITLVVSAPYYRPDTIRRRWQSHIPEERLALRSDDFARMIHYFSTGKVEDYEKRRQQLEVMFHDEARIFQEDPGTGMGVELYTKGEFIDKLTFPLASLQAITVLEVAYEQEQIVELRFSQETTHP